MKMIKGPNITIDRCIVKDICFDLCSTLCPTLLCQENVCVTKNNCGDNLVCGTQF